MSRNNSAKGVTEDGGVDRTASPTPLRDPKVREEYDRWVNLVGRMDPYVSKTTVGIHEVLHAHFLLVDYFRETGEGLGGVGPKDLNLLHSALSRQFVQFGGKPKWSDRLLICATLMFGLVKNHPFFDANKRTAFLVSILHLQKIGRTPTVPGEAFEDFIVAMADNKLMEHPDYENMHGIGSDRDILLTARFLRKSTREIDLRSKIITYNELNSILRDRGLFLDNPKGNRIDLMRRVDAYGETLATPKRIAHIGFHGWSREVSRRDIDIVREASKLDARHGFDSQSFFNGLEDPTSIIRKYQEPLRRLAFR